MDGGGSKTEVAIINDGGQVVALSRGGPINHQYVPEHEFRRTVNETLHAALAESGMNPLEVEKAGVCVLTPFKIVADTFRSIFPETELVHLWEPEIIMAQCGWFQQPGVAVVAGTGSNFCGFRDGLEKTVHFGGLGALLGDEGSGFDLAIRGLKAALQAMPGDERCPPTVLTDRMWAHFGVTERWEIVRLTTKSPLQRTLLASFAAEVAKAGAEGDPVALRICLDLAAGIAADILHVARRLFAPEEPVSVALGGGVLQGSSLISEAVRERVLRKYPLADVRRPSIPPAVAAARIVASGQQRHRRQVPQYKPSPEYTPSPTERM